MKYLMIYSAAFAMMMNSNQAHSDNPQYSFDNFINAESDKMNITIVPDENLNNRYILSFVKITD